LRLRLNLRACRLTFNGISSEKTQTKQRNRPQGGSEEIIVL
jgi:hypothetical protein